MYKHNEIKKTNEIILKICEKHLFNNNKKKNNLEGGF